MTVCIYLSFALSGLERTCTAHRTAKNVKLASVYTVAMSPLVLFPRLFSYESSADYTILLFYHGGCTERKKIVFRRKKFPGERHH